MFMLKMEKLIQRQKSVFLSYAQRVKGFRLWCPDSNSPKFIFSRDVTFDEFAMLH